MEPYSVQHIALGEESQLAQEEGLHLDAKRQRLENFSGQAFDQQRAVSAGDNSQPRRGQSQRSGQSILNHVETERRRRDRINEGFNQLRDLMPQKVKLDKATFLQQVVEYIKQLQGLIARAAHLRSGAPLPEDLQWSMLNILPPEQKRGSPQANHTVVAPIAQPVAAFAATSGTSAFYPFGGPGQQSQPATVAPVAPTPRPAGPALGGDTPLARAMAQVLPAGSVPSSKVTSPVAAVQPPAPAPAPVPAPLAHAPAQPTLEALQTALQLQQSMQAAGVDLQQLLQLQALLSGGQQAMAQAVPQPAQPLAAPVTAPAPNLWQLQQLVPLLGALPGGQQGAVQAAVAAPTAKAGSGESPDGDSSEPSDDANGTRARKNSNKVRRCTTASKIPKPDAAGKPQLQAGRPEVGQ